MSTSKYPEGLNFKSSKETKVKRWGRKPGWKPFSNSNFSARSLPHWAPVDMDILSPEPSPVDHGSSTKTSSSLSTKTSPPSSPNIPTATSIDRPRNSNPKYNTNMSSEGTCTPLPPSIDEIREPVPNTPLLTQVILGIISSIQTLSKKITPLEAAKEREEINIKAYNFCFEAAAKKHSDLNDLRELLADTGEHQKTWEKLLEQVLDTQMTLLEAVRNETEIREIEMERLRTEIQDLKVIMNMDQTWI